MSAKLLSPNFLLFLLGATILAIPMPVLIVLGGLAGAQLAPVKHLATLPVSVQLLAGLFVASSMSLFMGAFGRKAGFLLATVFAAVGGAVGSFALIAGSFWILCLAHTLLGAAVISFGFFRFAAAELVSTALQPSAISFTLGSGLVAAIVAPEIFTYSKDLMLPIPLAGAYLSITAIALVGAVPVVATRFHRPLVACAATGTHISVGRDASLFKRPRVLVAIICAMVSYAVMVLLMTPTSLAMVGCGHSEGQAGDVIRWHVIAMFAPSFVTGDLIERFGTSRVILAGGGLLLLSAVTAMSGLELGYFYASLILLGIGWNFGFVGATAMLNESLAPPERPLFQGINDTAVALGSTVASFTSGALISGFGWSMVAIAAVPVTCILLLGLATVRKPAPVSIVRPTEPQ